MCLATIILMRGKGVGLHLAVSIVETERVSNGTLPPQRKLGQNLEKTSAPRRTRTLTSGRQNSTTPPQWGRARQLDTPARRDSPTFTLVACTPCNWPAPTELTEPGDLRPPVEVV